jgi:putative chitinase
MKLTLKDLQELVKGFPSNEELVKWLNYIFEFYKINTPLRISAFLSNTGHECLSFKQFEEFASGRAYEGRKDLGNIYPGDGVKFKGFGAIMYTGRANYTRLSKTLNKDFVSNPKLLLEPEWAIKSAGVFWNEKKLNIPSDKGDIKTVRKTINGGFNGMIDVQERYVRCLQWFKSKGYS